LDARASQSSLDTALPRYRSGLAELFGAVEIRPKRARPGQALAHRLLRCQSPRRTLGTRPCTAQDRPVQRRSLGLWVGAVLNHGGGAAALVIQRPSARGERSPRFCGGVGTTANRVVPRPRWNAELEGPVRRSARRESSTAVAVVQAFLAIAVDELARRIQIGLRAVSPAP
jgi:hypothetical protein